MSKFVFGSYSNRTTVGTALASALKAATAKEEAAKAEAKAIRKEATAAAKAKELESSAAAKAKVAAIVAADQGKRSKTLREAMLASFNARMKAEQDTASKAAKAAKTTALKARKAVAEQELSLLKAQLKDVRKALKPILKELRGELFALRCGKKLILAAENLKANAYAKKLSSLLGYNFVAAKAMAMSDAVVVEDVFSNMEADVKEKISYIEDLLAEEAAAIEDAMAAKRRILRDIRKQMGKLAKSLVNAGKIPTDAALWGEVINTSEVWQGDDEATMFQVVAGNEAHENLAVLSPEVAEGDTFEVEDANDLVSYFAGKDANGVERGIICRIKGKPTRLVYYGRTGNGSKTMKMVFGLEKYRKLYRSMGPLMFGKKLDNADGTMKKGWAKEEQANAYALSTGIIVDGWTSNPDNTFFTNNEVKAFATVLQHDMANGTKAVVTTEKMRDPADGQAMAFGSLSKLLLDMELTKHVNIFRMFCCKGSIQSLHNGEDALSLEEACRLFLTSEAFAKLRDEGATDRFGVKWFFGGDAEGKHDLNKVELILPDSVSKFSSIAGSQSAWHEAQKKTWGGRLIIVHGEQHYNLNELCGQIMQQFVDATDDQVLQLAKAPMDRLSSFTADPAQFSGAFQKLVDAVPAIQELEAVQHEQLYTFGWEKLRAKSGRTLLCDVFTEIAVEPRTLLSMSLGLPVEYALKADDCFVKGQPEGNGTAFRVPSTGFGACPVQNVKPNLGDDAIAYLGDDTIYWGIVRRDGEGRLWVWDGSAWRQCDFDGDHEIISFNAVVNKLAADNRAKYGSIPSEMLMSGSNVETRTWLCHRDSIVAGKFGSRMGEPATGSFKLYAYKDWIESGKFPTEELQAAWEEFNALYPMTWLDMVQWCEVLTWLFIDMSKHGGSKIAPMLNALLAFLRKLPKPAWKRNEKKATKRCRTVRYKDEDTKVPDPRDTILDGEYATKLGNGFSDRITAAINPMGGKMPTYSCWSGKFKVEMILDNSVPGWDLIPMPTMTMEDGTEGSLKKFFDSLASIRDNEMKLFKEMVNQTTADDDSYSRWKTLKEKRLQMVTELKSMLLGLTTVEEAVIYNWVTAITFGCLKTDKNGEWTLLNRDSNGNLKARRNKDTRSIIAPNFWFFNELYSAHAVECAVKNGACEAAPANDYIDDEYDFMGMDS